MRFNIFRLFAILIATILLIVAFTFGVKSVEKKFIYKIDNLDVVSKYSAEYSLDPLLVFSIIRVESSFNQLAKSNAGAKGLMQITEKTGKYIAEKLNEKEYNLFDVKTNVRFGCYYLNYLIKKFKAIETAICAYNAGEGNVSYWLTKKEYSNDKTTLLYIPFSETRSYIEKIRKTFSKYKKLYGNILDKTENIE